MSERENYIEGYVRGVCYYVEPDNRPDTEGLRKEAIEEWDFDHASEAHTTTALERALWLLMDFDINRYLMANTAGRLNGGEKAERHLALCTTYCMVMLDVGLPNGDRAFGRLSSERRSLMMFIHDWTQTLTGYMDTEIGFPIEDRPDYDKLAPKFFARFIELCEEAVEAARIMRSRDAFKGEYSHIWYLNHQRSEAQS